MEQIIVDLTPNGIKSACHASQYDIGRHIRFALRNRRQVYTLTGTETVTVIMRKPDGTERTENLANTSSNYVDLVTSKDTCNLSGDYECELKVVNGDVEIGSGNFIMKVEPDAFDGVIEKKTASGAIASFETQLPFPLISVTVDVLASQSGSGTPYPAGGSAQKWDEEWEVGSYSTTYGTKTNNPNTIRCKNPIKVEPNSTYYFKAPNTGEFLFYDNNMNYIGFDSGVVANSELTIPTGVYFINFRMAMNYGTTYKNDISINTPSTDHDYHPYSNIRPINGYTEANITRCGVNLWDEDMESGSLSWGTGLPYVDNTRMRFVDYVKVEEGSSIYIVCPAAYDIHVFDINKEHITAVYKSAGGAYTIPSGGAYIKLTTQPAYGTTYNHDISINYPSTDTTYHAYNGNTYTISFGQTVYGGVLDVTRGKLTVTHVLLEKTVVSMNNNEDYPGWVNSGIKQYISTGGSYTNQIMNVGTVFNANITGANDILYLPKASYNNMTQSQWIANYPDLTIQIAVQLATPFDIDLTPVQISAIVGENNVYSDTNGDTEVEYIDLKGAET